MDGGRDGDASVCLPFFFPAGAGLYILQLMSERLAPSARGGLSLSDGFPVSICQVRLCTARRSPLLSPGYLLPLSPAGSVAAPGPLPTTAQRRGPRLGGSRRTSSGVNRREDGHHIRLITVQSNNPSHVPQASFVICRLWVDLRKVRSHQCDVLVSTMLFLVSTSKLVKHYRAQSHKVTHIFTLSPLVVK